MTQAQVVTILWLSGLALAAALLYGAAALWAVVGRSNLVWRFAPAILLLSALAPTGAYELMAVFGAQVAAIIGWVLLGRLVRGYRSSRSRGGGPGDALRSGLHELVGDGARFRLRVLLQFVLVVALVFAIIRFAEPLVDTTGGVVNWRGCLLLGLVAGTMMIAAEWLVFGHARWYFRVTAVGLATGVFGGLLRLLEGLDFFEGAALFFSFAGVLAIVRAAGGAWWRMSPNAEQHVADGCDYRSTCPWWRWPARAVLAVIAVADLSLTTTAYRVMLPASPPAIVLPNPNGYDELLRVANDINWSAVPTQDYEAASVSACRRFVVDNQTSLTALGDSLQIPSEAPFALDSDFIAKSLDDIQLYRELTCALAIQAKLARADGRVGDAASSYVAMLQLGSALGSGGVMVNDLVGVAIARNGLREAASILPQLDAEALANLRGAICDAAARHDPAAEVLQREHVFVKRSLGWPDRLRFLIADTSFESALAEFVSARHRYDALLRLLIAETAVRQYALEHGEPPESLAALVPSYLDSVPVDPFADGPLKYRRTGSGYLLYSVGIDGTDHGGVRATQASATSGTATDLFFDSPED